MELGTRELLPILPDAPILFGLAASDPFIHLYEYLKEIKARGFSGVANFPTIALIDGQFRLALEEDGNVYEREVEALALAHHLGLFTVAFVTREEEAEAMLRAGVDVICVHMGLTTKGSIGAETAVTLDDCCDKIRAIIAAGRSVRSDIMVICHGGPIADPEDAAYVIEHVPEIDGFFGASSIERLASERSMTKQAAAFKAIRK